MKFWYFFLILTLFSCSCLDRLPASGITFPDKNLEEIIVRGVYYPGGQRGVEALKKSFREEYLELNDGETIEEAVKNRYQHRLKEDFTHSGERYCYHKMIDQEPISNRDLRTRLYDKNGKVLAEDFLRTESEDELYQSITSYLPYHNEGYEIRIVRLEGTKETALYTTPFISHAGLLKVTRSNTQRDRHPPGIMFDTRDNCYVTSGSE